MCGRRGRLKGHHKSGEGSFLDPVRFATMSGGPRTGVLYEYNGREKSSIIRARSIHRREMTRERGGKKMVRLQVWAYGQWLTPIYHSTDFSKKWNQ